MAHSWSKPAPERSTDGSRPRAGALDPRTLTFLLTDVEGSTRLWERHPEPMRLSLARHDAILGGAIERAGGTVVKTMGDGLLAVFDSAVAALTAGLTAQRALQAEPWPEACAIRVRMGIHSGDAESRSSDFFGPTVNRTARIMAAGHGGQVLLSRATVALVDDRMPDGATLRDLGEHRLRDLERPERLYQLVHPELTIEFPPLATLDVRPNNLPTQASAFVGRDAELRGIRDLIDDDPVRLLTLTGPGGTGKTRLALRAAADQIDRFVDGVFFVDLAPARDTDGVVALIAGAIGLRETRERSPVDGIKRQLRRQRVLLVLDNFEQVIVAAPLLVDLLSESPGLKIMVTSREALHLRGEHLVPVPPLSVPGGGTAGSAAELGQFEAIQLFVERARAVRPDFRLTDDNAAAVADICRRLDGLPLAIELATARINLFAPEVLRDRLRSRLSVLGRGARDLPVRQQTLTATIDWSYQLLQPREQRLLDVLSTFSGADIAAVEAVAGGLVPWAGDDGDVVESLASLLDKSLIRQVQTDAAEARFVLLETIREYATEQLDSRPDVAASARERHAAYFTEYASSEWKRLTDAEPDASLAGLTREVENLRIAWRHWAEGRDLDRLDLLLDGLWHLYETRGWYHATIELIKDLLEVLSRTPPTPERWQQELTLRTSLPRALTLLRGYTGEVEDAYADALALFEQHREVPQLFPVLRSLASFYGFRGEFDKSVGLAAEIVRLAEAENNPSFRVDGYLLLGAYQAFLGDLPGGLGHLDEAIRWFDSRPYRPRRLQLGNDARVSCLTTSGFILWLLGHPDRAVDRADRAVALASEMGHPYSLAYALFHSGFLHVWRREPLVARDRAREVLRLVEDNDFPIWRALGTCLHGAATSALGDPTGGVEQLEDGLDQYQGLRTPPVFWPLVRYLQAGAHVEARRPEEGLALMDEALGLAGPDGLLAPLLHIVRGDLLLIDAHPDLGAALASYQRAFAVSERRQARMPQLRSAVRLFRVAGPDDREQRSATVRAIYETFEEGLATADLVEAAAIVDGPG